MGKADQPLPWRYRLGVTLVLLAGLALSIAMSRTAREDSRRNAELRFESAGVGGGDEVERRFAAYVEVLTGLRALFSTGEIPREAFKRYADALDLKRSFPGFQVLNFAPRVPGDGRDAFEAALRRELPAGTSPYAISPPGVRDEYQPLAMIEPWAGNERYIGKDIAAFPDVRAALDGARDTGRLSASGKMIQIRGQEGQIGLAMRMPVYRPGMPLGSVGERRAAYVGSVGAGFLVTRMLTDLPGIGPDVRLRVFDGGPEAAAGPRPAVLPDKLLFDTAGTVAAGRLAPKPETGQYLVQSFKLGGRIWLVEASAPFDAGVGPWERMLPVIILAGGCVISLLLAGVLFSLMGSKRRALGMALDMTRSLRISEQRLAEAQSLARLGSWVLDIDSGLIECAGEAHRIYGHAGGGPLTLEALLALVPEAQRGGLREAIERARQSPLPVEIEHAVQPPEVGEAAARWVHLTLQRSGDGADNGQQVRATVRDETSRRKAALRLELAHDIARRLAVEDNPERAIAYVMSSIGTLLQWHAAACWTRDAAGPVRCLHAWAQGALPQAAQFADAMHASSELRTDGHLEPAWTTGQPVWRGIPSGGDAQPGVDRVAAGFGLQAALVVPVMAGARRAALEFFNRSPVSVDRDSEGFMRSVASQLAQFLQRHQAEKALRYMANHDALTGLASRPLLHERLTQATQRAAEQGTRVAVLFMDLDRFKHVNDSLGHSAGDELLRVCARRLRECVRESDTVARFGGDEFVVLLEGLSGAADAVAPLTKILNRMSVPAEINGRELAASASIGVSMFPDDGQDVEALLMHADEAMYRAKEKGAGSYEFHSAQGHSHGQDRLALESSLHRALEREELFLVYQPKMELKTGCIVGVEALMRWRHPSLGLVSPAQFIPIAEDAGLIEAMGQWALEVACRDARRWQDQGQAVQVSVNLSWRQLNRPALVDEIKRVLAQSRLDPALLELEITESGVMRNPARAAAQLRELRELGMSVAIDDFGTGYSSLSYLQRFPLSTLKIDRSFIKDLPADDDAAALTAGIVGLAHRLRMTVVAEGVETIEQLGFLRASQCDQIQGYFLSKPITADEMSQFLVRDLRHLVGPAVAA
ncbi:bifunctional diguanylate cyclase/phosphodiesterase [Ideonella sp.]|uniref:bifunctional diguanylate cyclase/phosphodiesterase n=1 Tax=Ideonella sp. TaxID=1929293 RepID=UPI002B49657D|nr:EAL domain-containing protein [Ideonella sp.]HJV70967.1 EAL domain-containing protein [Ideonella sp.]